MISIKYKKELKSLFRTGMAVCIGCIIGSAIIPRFVFQDKSMTASRIIERIVACFIGIVLFSIVSFIYQIKFANKKDSN